MSGSFRLLDVDLEVLPFGERAILLRRTDALADPLVLPRLGERLASAMPDAVVDVVATEVELMIAGAQGVSLERLERSAIAALGKLSDHPAVHPRRFRLPVCFESGADWAQVERESSLDRFAYIARLQQVPLVLTMYGFVPGFLYMRGLPEALHCSRKAVPDQRAEAGSVAVGGPYFGIYGLPTPAGWNVIGHTPLGTATPRELPPTPFRIGDEFRVEQITSASLDELRRNPPSMSELRIDG